MDETEGSKREGAEAAERQSLVERKSAEEGRDRTSLWFEQHQSRERAKHIADLVEQGVEDCQRLGRYLIELKAQMVRNGITVSEEKALFMAAAMMELHSLVKMIELRDQMGRAG